METEMKEVIKEKVYEDGKKRYASEGKGNAGLSLGIIGTALGAAALWGRGNGLGGILGGGSMPENVNINTTSTGTGGSSVPTAFQAWEKECADAMALTNTIWGLKVNGMEQARAARELDVAEKFSMYKGYTEGIFGLYKKQNDDAFGLYKAGRDQFDVTNARISELSQKVAVMEAVRPYQDKLLQCEIGSAYNAAVNYTDKKTCRCIYGEVVLPNTPTVTGFEGANPFGCNCNRATATTPTA